MLSYEVNFDGLVGPTHNYAGLSVGNVASLSNAAGLSNPKQGAKQGLDKMKALADLGLKQALLPPLERPDIHTLRKLGFIGSDAHVLDQAARKAPEILIACCSASSMWTANACTMSPSSDCADNKVHFTAANLANKFHRSIEGPATSRILRAIFNDDEFFCHHQPLPLGDHFGDEGAANHTRFCSAYHKQGVEFFVYGKYAFDYSKPAPQKFPARQTLEASKAIARLHLLNEDKVVFAQQNPETIDKGVFHNDVIAVGNQNTLFYHQEAFLDSQKVLDEIKQKFGDSALYLVEVPSNKVSVEDAVKSYLFNSQLVTLSSGKMALISPSECHENETVRQYLDELVSLDNPIDEVKIFDVKQSMKNGGGPACLRQRVVLSEQEIAATQQGVFLTDKLYTRLHAWVDKHYRDQLVENDLADPQLLIESRTALDELTQILDLGSIYPFQDE